MRRRIAPLRWDGREGFWHAGAGRWVTADEYHNWVKLHMERIDQQDAPVRQFWHEHGRGPEPGELKR